MGDKRGQCFGWNVWRRRGGSSCHSPLIPPNPADLWPPGADEPTSSASLTEQSNSSSSSSHRFARKCYFGWQKGLSQAYPEAKMFVTQSADADKCKKKPCKYRPVNISVHPYLKWKENQRPTSDQWITEMSSNLELQKLTQKIEDFDKMWPSFLTFTIKREMPGPGQGQMPLPLWSCSGSLYY